MSSIHKATIVLEVIHLFTAYAISLPVVIYCLSHLFKNWNQPFVVKRRRSLFLFIVMLGVWALLIEYPYYDCVANTLFQVDWFVDMIMSDLGFLSRCILSSLISLRIYLLHYDHQYNRVLSTQKWQLLIDPSVAQNWYLVNRHKFGSHKFMILYILIPAFVFYFAIYAGLTVLFPYYGLIFNLTGSSFAFFDCAIIGYYYWRSFPKVHDLFFIRNELKISIKIFAIIGICVFMTSILILLTPHLAKIWMTLMLIIVQLIMTMVLYIMIIYPERKLNQNNNSNISDQMQMIGKSTQFISWEKIIESDDGYEQFATFLEKEFSTENILFCTEYVQLKNALCECEELKTIIYDKLGLVYTLQLPKSAPNSLISREFLQEFENTKQQTNGDESGQTMNDIIVSATKKLFLKYIDSKAALLEVNISSGVRVQLMNVFKALDISTNGINIGVNVVEQIMPLLESAVSEIAFLMNDSCYRFRRTEVFHGLISGK